MAEPEDLIVDAARHATVYARKLWLNSRSQEQDKPLILTDIIHRLELLILSAFGRPFAIRVAQPPIQPTLLARVFRQTPSPWRIQAIPANDGLTIWLPMHSPFSDTTSTQQWFRVLALQQAMRAMRNSAANIDNFSNPFARDVYLLLEGFSADEDLARRFPGCIAGLKRLREDALEKRPSLSAFSPARRPLEIFYRTLLAQTCRAAENGFSCESPTVSEQRVKELLPQLMHLAPDYSVRAYGIAPLVKDVWSGELRAPEPGVAFAILEGDVSTSEKNPRAARLPRSPEVRAAQKDEDKERKQDDAWMVQGDESHPKAEDPMGLQRPIDRENDAEAEEYADLVSELAEARLVSTPGQSKEILLSDNPTEKRSQLKQSLQEQHTELSYPEWDYHQEAYRLPGARVNLSTMGAGSQLWVDETLKQYQSLIYAVQKQFELLRAQRVLYRQQLDGEDIDLDAYVRSYTDFRAGDSLNQALYQTRRVAQKNIALSLLVDVSGSTDSWIANNRRVIDVEREALLLVAIALQSLGEPYNILAFSGDGPTAVTVREVKYASEPFNNAVALRISAMQPERFTRVGAAVRHATAELMRMPATHRLLIVLSDGKPNDNDNYEGRYGVEDTRQAVIEAKNQGIQPFCLTIDQHAREYLPYIFGPRHYALLPHPEQLPRVLLDWMKRLLVN